MWEGFFMPIRFLILKRRHLALLCAAVASAAVLAAASLAPKAVSAAAAQRQLPIYCVARDQKVCSISFDAAWGDGRMRYLTLRKELAIIDRYQSIYKKRII